MEGIFVASLILSEFVQLNIWLRLTTTDYRSLKISKWGYITHMRRNLKLENNGALQDIYFDYRDRRSDGASRDLSHLIYNNK